MPKTELKPLLVRSVIWPGESLLSFLTRLVKLNMYSSTALLDNLAFGKGKKYKLVWFQNISFMTQVPINNLYKASLNSLSHFLDQGENLSPKKPCDNSLEFLSVGSKKRHLWSRRDLAYCPNCLRERAYHRRDWFLINATACLDHHCLLIRKCPSCKSPLNINDLASSHCQICNYDLAESATIDLSHDSLGLLSQEVLHSWMNGNPLPESYTKMEPLFLQPGLLFRFLSLLSRTIASKPVLLSTFHHPEFFQEDKMMPPQYTPTLEQRYCTYATVFKAILNWPEGFIEFLDAYRYLENRKPTGYISSDFNHLHNDLNKQLFKNPNYEVVFDTYYHFIAQTYKLNYSILHLKYYRENEAFRKQFPHVPDAEAMKILGASREVVKRLNAYKFLNSQEGDFPEARLKVRIYLREDVFALKQKWESAMPLEDAAMLLGITNKIVVQFINEQLLEAVRGPSVDGSSIWAIRKEAVFDLLTLIQNNTYFPYSKKHELVSITYASQMLSCYGYNYVKVLRFVLESKIPCFWGTAQDQDLSNLQINKQNVKKNLQKLRENQPYVSRLALARRMGVKINTVKRWIERGLIPKNGELDESHLDRDDVEFFLLNHVFSDRAADLLGLTLLATQKWARKGRLKAVSGPGVDDCHRYLFRLKDVWRLRPENRLTTPEIATLLGMSKSQIHQWIRDEKIRPVSGPGIDEMKHYLFLRSELGEWDIEEKRL
ncbi:MAG: helix-turn-helix domain-containing protein [Ardenticatenaceae bacterium]|nr:helix-turn-helix domain-containing protein [Anaerolineales bacterium]MCB8919978.1 helix-turn-helix domain-containing protein [Ardenticatenaceae bacterium]MCB8989825.1 helix-turn-helix domain-containing protein [Ardenticatenaceae bacterium]